MKLVLEIPLFPDGGAAASPAFAFTSERSAATDLYFVTPHLLPSALRLQHNLTLRSRHVPPQHRQVLLQPLILWIHVVTSAEPDVGQRLIR